MTDEEKLAEEYVKSVIDVDAFDWKIGREIALAYIEGLKAGRPKWHKVADGDLPRQDGHTCFSIEVLANNKKWIHYRFDSAKWFCGSKEVKVIAWCEIPQYKEAKE